MKDLPIRLGIFSNSIIVKIKTQNKSILILDCNDAEFLLSRISQVVCICVVIKMRRCMKWCDYSSKYFHDVNRQDASFIYAIRPFNFWPLTSVFSPFFLQMETGNGLLMMHVHAEGRSDLVITLKVIFQNPPLTRKIFFGFTC